MADRGSGLLRLMVMKSIPERRDWSIMSLPSWERTPRMQYFFRKASGISLMLSIGYTPIFAFRTTSSFASEPSTSHERPATAWSSTIAMLYASSPVEHAALHTLNAPPSRAPAAPGRRET